MRMPFNTGQDVAVPEWVWVLGLLILLLGAIVLGVLHPFAAAPLAVALIVGGIVAYRQSTNAVVRAIAAGAIAAGTLIILTVILVGLSIVAQYTV